MKLLRLAAPLAIGLSMIGGAHAMPATSGAMPSIGSDLIQAQQYYRERAPRLFNDNRPRFRGYGYGRPRVVCRVVRERRVNPYNGRVRIVSREICRPRGPRW